VQAENAHTHWRTTGCCYILVEQKELWVKMIMIEPVTDGNEEDKSQLTQTNPRDALSHAQRVVHKGGRSV